MAEGNGKRLWLGIPSAALAVLTIMGIAWKFLVAPALIAAVSDAVADDVDRKINQSVAAYVAPINAGLKATIQSAIAQFEDDIAALEYRQSLQDGSWSAEDAQRLANKRRRLREQRMALDAIERAELAARVGQ